MRGQWRKRLLDRAYAKFRPISCLTLAPTSSPWATTPGNRREIVPYLDESPYLLRPANFAPQLPGRGWGTFETKAGFLTVVNLIGRCNMDFGPDNPFLMADAILRQAGTRLNFLDFHAEATSEKLAMGYYLDGRASAVWGTHTHVPTCDCQVLPRGYRLCHRSGHEPVRPIPSSGLNPNSPWPCSGAILPAVLKPRQAPASWAASFLPSTLQALFVRA